MFLHTKILLENKFNHILKLVKKTGMSKYWFMENHFIPTLLHKNSMDISSFMNNLEKSFSKLVEATMVSESFADLHKEMGGGDAAEKEAIAAVRDFVFGKEGNLDNILHNINIPELTSGKTALVKKLVSDLSKFISNYKFQHPEKPEEAFIDKKAEKDTVNKILGRPIAALLGNPGNVYDDLVAFDIEKIKSYYAGIDSMAEGNFSPEQIDMLNKNNFEPTSIQNLADKIRNIIIGKVSRTGSKEEAEQILMPKKESYNKDQKIWMKALSLDDVVKAIKVVDKDSGHEYNAQNVEGLKDSIKNREVAKIDVITKLRAAKEFLTTKINRPRIASQIDSFLDQIHTIQMIKAPKKPAVASPEKKAEEKKPQGRPRRTLDQIRQGQVSDSKKSAFRQAMDDIPKDDADVFMSEEEAAQFMNMELDDFLELATKNNIEGKPGQNGFLFKKLDVENLKKNYKPAKKITPPPPPPPPSKPASNVDPNTGRINYNIDDIIGDFE